MSAGQQGPQLSAPVFLNHDLVTDCAYLHKGMCSSTRCWSTFSLRGVDRWLLEVFLCAILDGFVQQMVPNSLVQEAVKMTISVLYSNHYCSKWFLPHNVYAYFLCGLMCTWIHESDAELICMSFFSDVLTYCVMLQAFIYYCSFVRCFWWSRAHARVCVCMYVVHWHCTAQLSMFDMEKRFRNKIIIIILLYGHVSFTLTDPTHFYCPLLIFKPWVYQLVHQTYMSGKHMSLPTHTHTHSHSLSLSLWNADGYVCVRVCLRESVWSVWTVAGLKLILFQFWFCGLQKSHLRSACLVTIQFFSQSGFCVYCCWSGIRRKTDYTSKYNNLIKQSHLFHNHWHDMLSVKQSWNHRHSNVKWLFSICVPRTQCL